MAFFAPLGFRGVAVGRRRRDDQDIKGAVVPTGAALREYGICAFISRLFDFLSFYST